MFEWDEAKAAHNLDKHGVSFYEAETVSMKKDEAEDELLPEYDFAQMTGGVRGKYAAAYRRSHHLVRLDPDVAKAFTTDAAVNEALRAVLRAAAAISGGAFAEEGTSSARVAPRS